MKRRCYGVLLSLLALPALSAGAAAQSGRAALRAGHEAYEFGDYEGALRNYTLGLNPAAGERDSLWISGVYRLAETLLSEGGEGLADAWLRWAFRQSPNMPIDTVWFAPDVLRRFQAARTFADSTQPRDVTFRLSWVWPTTPPSGTQPGAVRLQPKDVEVSAQFDDRFILPAGVDRTLPPGTHRLQVSAPEYLPANVRVEVLPGVTTVVDVDLVPLYAGLLYVASEPWAEVYVDGERVGYTMLGAHSLVPGVRRISIVRDGFVRFDTTVVVAQSDSIRLGTIQLRRVGGGSQP